MLDNQNVDNMSASALLGEPRRDHDRKQLMASLPEGFTLLIVEANMILALDVEDMLLRGGATRVDVVGTCEEAFLTLETTSYHAAVLDLNLPQGNILPVAARLAELGVPFAFCASHGERASLPEPYAAAVLINTPCNDSYLMSALARLLGPSTAG
jgi:CheY-like chemotaxis protein